MKTQAYLSSVEFSQRRRLGCIGFQDVKFFFASLKSIEAIPDGMHGMAWTRC
jgi:hypothetical protein